MKFCPLCLEHAGVRSRHNCFQGSDHDLQGQGSRVKGHGWGTRVRVLRSGSRVRVEELWLGFQDQGQGWGAGVKVFKVRVKGQGWGARVIVLRSRSWVKVGEQGSGFQGQGSRVKVEEGGSRSALVTRTRFHRTSHSGPVCPPAPLGWTDFSRFPAQIAAFNHNYLQRCRECIGKCRIA